MIDRPAPLTCTGREVDDQLRPVGDACGRRFEPSIVGQVVVIGGCPLNVVATVSADGAIGPAPWRHPTAAEQEDQARADGWAVLALPDGSRVATCPKCRKPSSRAVAACRAIEHDLLAREPDRPAST